VSTGENGYAGWRNWHTWAVYTYATNEGACYKLCKYLAQAGAIEAAVTEAIRYAKSCDGDIDESAVARDELAQAFAEL